ncbi:Bacterial extracellular solute-binding protein [compost metagenome]
MAPDKLYPLDLDRALRKLDTIKSDILWWGSGDESQQLLSSGQASLGMFWNGRVHALKQSGASVEMNWRQNLVTGDFLVIPRGAKQAEAAKQFLGYASRPKAQAAFASLTGYAPVNLSSAALIAPELAGNLPSAHRDSQITLNFKYWSKNSEAISRRWYAWQAQ